MLRCEHCNDVYIYHPSAYGFLPENNDNRFCPKCFEVIQKALKHIKPKFIKKWIKTDDYTKEEILTAREERHKNNPLSLDRFLGGCLFDCKVTQVVPLAAPVGLVYALRFIYSDNDKTENSWDKEIIKEENKEYPKIKEDVFEKLEDDSKPKEEAIEIKGFDKSTPIDEHVEEMTKNINNKKIKYYNHCERMEDPISKEKIYYSVFTINSDEPEIVEIKKEIWWDVLNNKVADNQRVF